MYKSKTGHWYFICSENQFMTCEHNSLSLFSNLRNLVVIYFEPSTSSNDLNITSNSKPQFLFLIFATIKIIELQSYKAINKLLHERLPYESDRQHNYKLLS